MDDSSESLIRRENMALYCAAISSSGNIPPMYRDYFVRSGLEMHACDGCSNEKMHALPHFHPIARYGVQDLISISTGALAYLQTPDHRLPPHSLYQRSN